MSAEIRSFLTEKIPLTKTAKDKLKLLSQLDDVIGVAALPDIHAKPDNPFPTGTAVLTNNTVYPTLIGQDIGCAMSVWGSSFKAAELDQSQIRQIFAELSEQVTDNKPKRNYVSDKELRSIITDGAQWARRFSLISDEECRRIEEQGCFVADKDKPKAASAFPPDAWKGGLRKAKSLGGGNHFLELQRIVEILDEEAADILGLQEDDVLIWIHTGSSSFGKRLENFYTQRWNTADARRRLRQKWRRLFYHVELNKLNRLKQRLKLVEGIALDEGLDARSPEGERYMLAHNAALNYALVNRVFLAHMMKQAFRKVHPSVDFTLLIDVAHESIRRERFNDKDCWVHRNGASRALSPSMHRDPWGKGLGQLLPLPGSLGTDSYLALSCEGVEASFRSVNHGAGRVLEKPDAKKKVSPEELSAFEKLKGRKIFYAGKGEDLIEQVPSAFKDISEVAKALEKHNLAKIIARTGSIASLKS